MRRLAISETGTYSLEEKLPRIDGGVLAESVPKCPESRAPLSIASFVDETMGSTIFDFVSAITWGGSDLCGDRGVPTIMLALSSRVARSPSNFTRAPVSSL